MLEKIAGYRIHIVNVKGINHTVADRLSRYPVSSQLAPEFNVNPPEMCHKSLQLLRTGVYLKDPLLKRLSILAEKDEEYQDVLRELGAAMKSNDLRNDSPLKKKEGDLSRLSIQVINSVCKIVVRDSLEVLIPHNMQDELIEKMHETHLATESMMKLVKDRFYWTGMRKQLFKKYNDCEDVR